MGLSRRKFLGIAGVSVASSLLAGCDESELDLASLFDESDGSETYQDSPDYIPLPPAVRDGLSPALELPTALREPNWTATGSCGHASMCTMFERLGLDDLSRWWRKHYSGGESLEGLISKCERNKIDYYVSTRSNLTLLDWCSRTGRYAVVNDSPGHIRTFAGMDASSVYIIDNNPHNNVKTPTLKIPRATWMSRNWRSGWAIAATYPVGPPVTI